MIINILVFLLSIVPTVLIFLWLRKRKKDSENYIKATNSAFLRGFIGVLPIIGVSAVIWIVLTITGTLTGIKQNIPLLYQAFYTFFVLAFAEELVKFLAFRGLIKKKFYSYSWADIVAFMTIIGLAFGLIEDIPYAIGASPMVMIVRGVTMGHVGYGFIMGWFYGKSLYTGKKLYAVIAFALPWLMHGIYDFSLSEQLMKINDNFAFIGVSMALLDLVALVLMFRFFIKARKKEKYNQPLVLAEEGAGVEVTENK
ncbi:MAG: PrsW family intramembrane metalloprotease [Eubacterium sp.]|nr:PrsW family intramembrane metalloprotease [Eubacterium sp.]